MGNINDVSLFKNHYFIIIILEQTFLTTTHYYYYYYYNLFFKKQRAVLVLNTCGYHRLHTNNYTNNCKSQYLTSAPLKKNAKINLSNDANYALQCLLEP